MATNRQLYRIQLVYTKKWQKQNKIQIQLELAPMYHEKKFNVNNGNFVCRVAGA